MMGDEIGEPKITQVEQDAYRDVAEGRMKITEGVKIIENKDLLAELVVP